MDSSEAGSRDLMYCLYPFVITFRKETWKRCKKYSFQINLLTNDRVKSDLVKEESN